MQHAANRCRYIALQSLDRFPTMRFLVFLARTFTTGLGFMRLGALAPARKGCSVDVCSESFDRTIA